MKLQRLHHGRFADDPEIHGVVEQSADDISPAPVHNRANVLTDSVLATSAMQGN
jgi:hypothetical protein